MSNTAPTPQVNHVEMTQEEWLSFYKRFCEDLRNTIRPFIKPDCSATIITVKGNPNLPKGDAAANDTRFVFATSPQLTRSLGKADYLTESMAFASRPTLQAIVAGIGNNLILDFRDNIDLPVGSFKQKALDKAISAMFTRPVDVFTKGIFVKKNAEHRVAKKQFQMAGVYTNNMDSVEVLQTMQNSIRDAFATVQDGESRHPFNVTHLISFRNFAKFAFNVDVTNEECRKLASGFEVINQKLVNRILNPAYFDALKPHVGMARMLNPLEKSKEQEDLLYTVGWVKNFIKDRIEERIENSNYDKPQDYLDTAIDAAIKRTVEENPFISESAPENLTKDLQAFFPSHLARLAQHVQEDCFSALIAGGETTAVTSSYFIHKIAHDQNLQQRMKTEIKQNKHHIYDENGKVNTKVLRDENILPLFNEVADAVPRESSPLSIGFPLQVWTGDNELSIKSQGGGTILQEGDTVIPIRFDLDNKISMDPFNGQTRHNCSGKPVADNLSRLTQLKLLEDWHVEINQGSIIPEPKPDTFTSTPQMGDDRYNVVFTRSQFSSIQVQ